MTATAACHARSWARVRPAAAARGRPAAIGLLVAASVIVGSAIAAPIVAPLRARPRTTSTPSCRRPTGSHPFGTDELGRDILSRVIWGARASMQAGVLATLLAVVVAVPVGLVAGYYRGVLDTIVMRVTDALLAFPFLIIAVRPGGDPRARRS